MNKRVIAIIISALIFASAMLACVISLRYERDVVVRHYGENVAFSAESMWITKDGYKLKNATRKKPLPSYEDDYEEFYEEITLPFDEFYVVKSPF